MKMLKATAQSSVLGPHPSLEKLTQRFYLQPLEGQLAVFRSPTKPWISSLCKYDLFLVEFMRGRKSKEIDGDTTREKSKAKKGCGYLGLCCTCVCVLLFYGLCFNRCWLFALIRNWCVLAIAKVM